MLAPGGDHKINFKKKKPLSMGHKKGKKTPNPEGPLISASRRGRGPQTRGRRREISLVGKKKKTILSREKKKTMGGGNRAG